MPNAAHAARKLDHLSARIPIAADAAVMEFTKPRLSALTKPTGAAVPAYTVTARVLHWITALVIALMIPLGVIIGNDWGGRLQNSLYGLHVSLGALLLVFLEIGFGEERDLQRDEERRRKRVLRSVSSRRRSRGRSRHRPQ